ncbi:MULTISPECIES: MFS transporter [unclassified Actinomyces]|uniref:MFS transporter n=1 Tax=unclassified Actinomyces TaxID=2609248 RepID=UPI0013A6FF72|nr:MULTISPECIES: MFS transporter [unclassified Actinomyces]MBW3068112.1 MFS transporter [Actinomyces sp. 594]NDR53017.1 MFS transporter [Actinomyces sp. 565]
MTNPSTAAAPSGRRATQEEIDAFFAPPTKQVGPFFIVSYLAAQLFFFIALMGPAILSIQTKSMAMFPDDNAAQTAAVSHIAGLGALGAVFANVIFGQISDRTMWRWGRRRPWLVIGILGMTVGLVIMGLTNTVPAVAVGWLIAQIGANAALAPFVAVLSDQVPEFQRARISSMISIAQNLAILIATYLSGALREQLEVLFIAPAIPAILFMTWFAFVLPDKQLTIKPPRLDLIGLIKTFWVNPIAYPDYGLAWAGRFLITLCSFSFTTYRLFFLVHRVNLTEERATDVVATSVLIYTIALMAASFVGGQLSDRLHRRKAFVFAASALFGLGTVMLAHTTTVSGFYMVEAVMGLAYGVYISVDLALVVDVLPNPDNAGKDLGVFNIANALPQSLAPYMAPLFLGIGSAEKMNYPALCYFAGICAIVGGVLAIFIKKVK